MGDEKGRWAATLAAGEKGLVCPAHTWPENSIEEEGAAMELAIVTVGMADGTQVPLWRVPSGREAEFLGGYLGLIRWPVATRRPAPDDRLTEQGLLLEQRREMIKAASMWREVSCGDGVPGSSVINHLARVCAGALLLTC